MLRAFLLVLATVASVVVSMASQSDTGGSGYPAPDSTDAYPAPPSTADYQGYTATPYPLPSAVYLDEFTPTPGATNTNLPLPAPTKTPSDTPAP